jgi:hypothetical protein
VQTVTPAAPRIVKTRDHKIVPIVSHGLVDQSKIRTSIQQAKRALEPDVIRIMFAFVEDWTEEYSLFFRIILSDAASSPNKLRETTQRVRLKILREIKGEELGLQCYFNFRSQSEQAKLREPAWEP